jgi:hypothetical protein
MEWGLE